MEIIFIFITILFIFALGYFYGAMMFINEHWKAQDERIQLGFERIDRQLKENNKYFEQPEPTTSIN